ncbi:MAG TPA: hypothetical protein VJ998_10790 [Pseudomonadales bacterium]|nr:hypothetical protein [Pseudomonadales bacterium]
MRNAFGAVFSRTLLPSHTTNIDNELAKLTGDPFGVGLDMRAALRRLDFPSQTGNVEFNMDRTTLYVTAKPSASLRLYLDEEVSQSGATNRETWAKYSFGSTYLKAGRIFLPYGLRLEDDSAFIRDATRVQFGHPDTGIEFGHVGTHVSAQVAVTNGTEGGPEVDSGKQVTGRFSWVEPGYRVGLSASGNNTSTTDRTMFGAFAGILTGPIDWLAEYDHVKNSLPGSPDNTLNAAYLEADWKVTQGGYFRVTAETLRSPSNTAPDNNRYTVEYSWYPVPMAQLRFVASMSDYRGANPFMNYNNYFVQIHLYL